MPISCANFFVPIFFVPISEMYFFCANFFCANLRNEIFLCQFPKWNFFVSIFNICPFSRTIYKTSTSSEKKFASSQLRTSSKKKFETYEVRNFVLIIDALFSRKNIFSFLTLEICVIFFIEEVRNFLSLFFWLRS